MRPLTHDYVCLVSDTERQPTREVGREGGRRKRKEMGERPMVKNKVIKTMDSIKKRKEGTLERYWKSAHVITLNCFQSKRKPERVRVIVPLAVILTISNISPFIIYNL